MSTAALRVAMLAPPWITIPPPGYGGIEAVIATLTQAMVARGHDVTLFAPPGSAAGATVRPLLRRAYPDQIGLAMHEVDHVAQAFAAIDREAAAGRPFDIIHDHCGFAAIAYADRIQTPLLHTLHGPFTAETTAFYRAHAHKAWVSALSRSQLESGPDNLQSVGVIANPIDPAEWPLRREKDGFLLWIGRMTKEKGPHRAIAAARLAGWPLVLAGVVQPVQRRFFAAYVEAHVDGEQVRFVGEVGGADRRQLFAAASALLMPIRWREPFGMVMAEAMACGTPVLAFAEGAAIELVSEGETGFLVANEEEMGAAVGRLADIDPTRCRATILALSGAESVAERFEAAYRTVIAARP
jgi:glycosyltransferase involved in cell wall biosynthesis